MAIERWKDNIPDSDLAVYTAANCGQTLELKNRPALLVVDVTYEFTGETAVPILEAVNQTRTACGETAWEAVSQIKKLIERAHQCGVIVIYTLPDPESKETPFSKSNYNSLNSEVKLTKYGIVDEIIPLPGDIIIKKIGPSAFFGTNLLFHLISRNIDTMIITGGTTSGCVRASAIDAFSYGYRLAVVKDATFDRFVVSHSVSLFDLEAKHSKVISAEETIDYFTQVKGIAKL